MRVERSHLSFRPTGQGLLFLTILIAMLLGSINYNNNAGFALVFLLGSMTFISLFHSFRNLLGLDVALLDVQGVFAGQPLIFPFQIKAEPLKGDAMGRSKEPVAGHSLSMAFKNIPVTEIQHSRHRTDLVVDTRKRGRFEPGTLEVFSSYPFGLFRLSASLPLNAGGLVYPEPLKGRLSRGRSGQGDDTQDNSTRHAKNSAGSEPDDFQGLNPYIPGSPLGRIAWKTYSRGQGLFVKDFSSADAGQQVLLDLDLIKTGGMEAKLSILCQALIDARRAGIFYGLRLKEGIFHEPGKGDRHFYQCLESLALFGDG